ncbi:MAG: DUF1653 domain-containing protein [Acutalibacteraceae bacterium]
MSNWVNQSVFYHIYPLGFCGAPEYNDLKLEHRILKLKEWIPHLKKLNVNAIYLGPVFDSLKHGYDTKDYYQIDTRLGDIASFKELCDELHANGIRIVLDGVFNHVGREFWAFKDVQEKREASPYCGWFQNLNFGGRSPMGDPFWYEGWSGHYDLVKLNLKNPEVVNHLLGAVELWMNEFKIDGIRLDAADCIDFDFFKTLRSFCKSKNPDFWLMGEIIHGDYTRWANPDMLDSVTNYECYKGIYSSHNDHNYFEIAHSLQRQFANGGIYSNICTYNFVDNHDVNRVADNCRDSAHLNNVYTVLYTMPGVPSVYYGSEWGIHGTRTQHSDKELRPCLDLGQIPNANEELCTHISKLGFIKTHLPALQFGRFENIVIKNEQLVYKRFSNDQIVYAAFNVNGSEQRIGFNVDGGYSKLTDVLTGDVFDVNGWAEIPLAPNSSRILVLNNGEFSLSFENSEPETIINTEKTEAAAEEAAAEDVVPLAEVTKGRYRHFKGGEYEVLAVAKHSETGEQYVVYEAMYNGGGTWVRPLSMFCEVVEIDGKKMNRFTKLS